MTNNFNNYGRKKKNQGNKKTVMKSINYVEETYSTILYDEDFYEESSSSSDEGEDKKADGKLQEASTDELLFENDSSNSSA